MFKNGIAKSAPFIGLIILATWLAVACGPNDGTLEQVTPTPLPAGEAAATPAAEDTTTPPPTSTVETPAAPTPDLTPTVETPTPAGTENISDADTTLNLRTAIVKLDSARNPTILASGDELMSCVNPADLTRADSCENLYSLYFIPDQDAYIYALQQDSTGTIYTLFPNEEYSSQENPVPADTTIWVPRDVNHWFWLDENIGRETIFVVASPEPINELEELIGNVTGASPVDPAPVAQLIAWLTDGSRGPGGITESSTSVSLPNGGPPRELETIVLEAAGDREFVYWVEFENVPPGLYR